MAADFLIFEPSFFFDGHTAWLEFVLLVCISEIDFGKSITTERLSMTKKNLKISLY